MIRSNQKGATMLEMLGVLTIIITLAISTIKLVGNIMGVFRQSLMISEVQDLQKAISDRYKFEGTYQDLLEGKTPEEVITYLCQNKIAPFQMCRGDKLYNRMGGRVWVMPVENYDGDGNAFTDYEKYALVFWGLNDKACFQAAQINWYRKQKSDVFKMVINSGNSKQLIVDMPHNLQAGSKSFPVPVADVTNACKNDNNNTIEWVFY